MKTNDRGQPEATAVPSDIAFLERAIKIALEAEIRGNLPVGALITLSDDLLAEGGSAIIVPSYHPGRHAEMEALCRVPVERWPEAREMTCYTTLEPCLMCYGALVLHGVGRIVFGAADSAGGASSIHGHLPPYYSDQSSLPEWIGPVMREKCDPLYERSKKLFDKLPCGTRS